MHSLEICALLDVRGFFFFFYYFAVSMPTSLAEPAPVGACQDLAGFIDALWWCSTITVEMAAAGSRHAREKSTFVDNGLFSPQSLSSERG